jgi:hypothetical protein
MDDSNRQRLDRQKRGTQSKPLDLKQMNRDAILGIVRHILTTGGGVLVTNGTLTSEQLQTGAGSLIVLVGIIWSVWAKKKEA